MNPHQLLMQEEGITYAELPSKAKAAITNFNSVVRMATLQKDKQEAEGKAYKMSSALKEKLEFIDDGIVSLLDDYIEQKDGDEQNHDERSEQKPKNEPEEIKTSNEPQKRRTGTPFMQIINADGRIHADELKPILGVRSINDIDDEITIEGIALSRRMGYWYK